MICHFIFYCSNVSYNIFFVVISGKWKLHFVWFQCKEQFAINSRQFCWIKNTKCTLTRLEHLKNRAIWQTCLAFKTKVPTYCSRFFIFLFSMSLRGIPCTYPPVAFWQWRNTRSCDFGSSVSDHLKLCKLPVSEIVLNNKHNCLNFWDKAL